MSAGIEELVLSGALFTNSRSSSPVRSPSRSRSPSPDPLWPSNDSDGSLSPSGSLSNLRDVPAETSMGPSRTGVKGIIQDHELAVGMERAKRARDIEEANRRMEKKALNARTYAEDEEERLREKAREEGRSENDTRGRRLFERAGRFGHLREVGVAGFIEAVEEEMNGTWVVIHIYDPSLARCHDLDAILARLARQHPQTKFLRARAGAVGFASSSSTAPSNSRSDSNLTTIREGSYSDDEDDPYLYDDDAAEEAAQDTTDTEMLPTLLAYCSGELVHTWVRVDWEAEAWTRRGEKNKSNGTTNAVGVEALLQGHSIIKPSSNGNCGFSSDDDDLDLDIVQGDGGVDDDELFDL